MVNGRSNPEMLQLKRMLSRNITVLKKRIAGYDHKLKGIDPQSPAGKIYIAEKLRTEEVMKNLMRMQTPLAYMS